MMVTHRGGKWGRLPGPRKKKEGTWSRFLRDGEGKTVTLSSDEKGASWGCLDFKRLFAVGQKKN